MPVELLERDAVRAATGTDRYRAALLDRRGGFVNPLGYARGLAQAAMQAGARVHGATPALSVAREGAAWAVRTPRGTVRAEHLVLATNGYTDDLWPVLRRSIVPVFSGIVATEPLPDAVAAQVMPSRSVLYELGSITTYYRLDAARRLLMGGRSPLREIGTAGELSYLVNYARRLYPALRDVPFRHGWSGQLAITTDHYPHIHQPAPGVLACLGYNGRGVAMATAMGRQIARHLATGEAIDMPVTTLRAIPYHGLWRNAVAARVVYGRIRDWIDL